MAAPPEATGRKLKQAVVAVPVVVVPLNVVPAPEGEAIEAAVIVREGLLSVVSSCHGAAHYEALHEGLYCHSYVFYVLVCCCSRWGAS